MRFRDNPNIPFNSINYRNFLTEIYHDSTPLIGAVALIGIGLAAGIAAGYAAKHKFEMSDGQKQARALNRAERSLYYPRINDPMLKRQLEPADVYQSEIDYIKIQDIVHTTYLHELSQTQLPGPENDHQD